MGEGVCNISMMLAHRIVCANCENGQFISLQESFATSIIRDYLQIGPLPKREVRLRIHLSFRYGVCGALGLQYKWLRML